MRRPSCAPARYISLGSSRTFEATPTAGNRQSSNAGILVAVASPLTNTNSIEPSSRTIGVRMATQCSPLAWNAVTRDQRRERRS